MTVTLDSLLQAKNCLPLQALFYTDGCRSHLDLGSNDGRTLRGLDPSIITAVELFGPSVELLRKAGFADVVQMDIREYCAGKRADIQFPAAYSGSMPVCGKSLYTHDRFDRVTAFDVIEHIPRADGERLLDQIEQITTREIVIFMPIETPELEATERWQQFREDGLSEHPDGQRELHDHKSRWSPEDFQKRGYITLTMPDFHYSGFGAFFAAKYRDAGEQKAVLARVQEWAAKQGKPKQSQTQTWGHLGKGSGVIQPLFLNGTERMFLGDGVGIGYGARLEAIREYGGVEHSPTLVIGDGTTAEFFLHVGCAERVTIGRDCMLAGNVFICDHQHGYDTSRPLHGQPLTVKPISIGDSVFIGEGVQILPGAKIGDRAVIGAHSVVTGEVPAYAVVAGTPARAIRFLEWSRYVPLVSIVIPTISRESERLAYCLRAIADHTPESHEVLIIEDFERRGFAVSCNEGIARARGDFILLLNDDTEVTSGWLSRMLAVMEHFPEVGLVGPCSDNVSGLQCRAPIAGPISQEVGRLVGFCLLIRRSVIEKIGGLDTSFGLNFEDDDFGLRAQAAGFKLRIALDAFVRHVGQATFAEAGINHGQAMAAAWQVFQAKWGAKELPDGYRVAVPFWDERCYVPLGAEVMV